MLGGNRPWAGMSHAAVVDAVCTQRRGLEPPPGAPEGVAFLASACMARDPSERPSFREILEILDAAAAAIDADAWARGDEDAGAADAGG
jgi:hypothetical protein